MLPIAEWIEEQIILYDRYCKISRAGSIRRVRETVKDLDFIIATNNVQKVKEQFLQMPKIKSVTNDGDTKVSVVFEFDYEVSADFRLVEPHQFATTLHHFTGSKEHNVRMRQLAKERKEKISEYGVEQLETGEVLTFRNRRRIFINILIYHLLVLNFEKMGRKLIGWMKLIHLITLDRYSW